MTQDKKTVVSIIVSVYNEQDALYQFSEKLKSVIENLTDYFFQVYFVNDGSKDDSQKIIDKIISESDSNIEINSIEFSRNFGHEAAMLAGIDQSTGDVIICMDSDLQHPPEKISDMLAKYHKGNDIILMKRVLRKDNGFIKRSFSNLFYKLMDSLSATKFEQNASDFFLISSKIADIMRTNFRERNRFLRGFIQIIGFNITTVDFEAPSRIAGESNYSFRSLFKLGFTAIFAFSNKPLKISLFFSFIFFFISLALITYSLIIYFFGDKPPSGYTTIIIFQAIGFTVLSFLISILSIYFGRSLEEIRDRPIYLIKNFTNNNNV